jgi:signal transduction histidine kinase
VHEVDPRGKPRRDNRHPVRFHHESGDVDAGRRQAKHVVEGTFETQRIQQSCMGTAGCIAELDASDNLTIWTKTQIPFLAQRDFIEMLAAIGLEGRNARVVVPALGGGFGTGLDTHAYEYIAILLARRTGKPVKIVYNRDEEFACLSPRQSARTSIAQGCDERGRLTRRLDALAREAERLRGILADFLEFAGRMKLDPQPRDLVTLVEELRDFFLPQCEQAGIVLRTQLPEAPITIPVDEGLIKQAILNLMINAAEAMKGGATTAAVEHEKPARIGDLMLRVDADGTEARVHVIDTGPGVEADQIDEIFHPYVSTKASGTGLGLPTARRIVEEHGGRLEAHSEPGRGSDFIVHLPVERDGGEPRR